MTDEATTVFRLEPNPGSHLNKMKAAVDRAIFCEGRRRAALDLRTELNEIEDTHTGNVVINAGGEIYRLSNVKIEFLVDLLQCVAIEAECDVKDAKIELNRLHNEVL